MMNADRLGLAQLYQLRGRVGRSGASSYVYFVVPPELKDCAKKRINTIKSVNSLGSGLNIAMQDMDIRGFGNVIGEAQSGKIKEVGIELYKKTCRDINDGKSTYDFCSITRVAASTIQKSCEKIAEDLKSKKIIQYYLLFYS